METPHKTEVSPTAHNAVHDPVGFHESGVAEAVAQILKERTSRYDENGKPKSKDKP